METKQRTNRRWQKMCIRDSYYSQARESSNVPVDYTPVKYVKKTAGGRPGMVVYTTCKTLFVTPDADQVKALQAQ